MEGKRRQGRGGHFRQRSQPDTATLGLEWAGQNRVGLSEDMDATCRRLSVASKDAAFVAAAAAETEGAGTRERNAKARHVRYGHAKVPRPQKYREHILLKLVHEQNGTLFSHLKGSPSTQHKSLAKESFGRAVKPPSLLNV